MNPSVRWPLLPVHQPDRRRLRSIDGDSLTRAHPLSKGAPHGIAAEADSPGPPRYASWGYLGSRSARDETSWISMWIISFSMWPSPLISTRTLSPTAASSQSRCRSASGRDDVAQVPPGSYSCWSDLVPLRHGSRCPRIVIGEPHPRVSGCRQSDPRAHCSPENRDVDRDVYERQPDSGGQPEGVDLPELDEPTRYLQSPFGVEIEAAPKRLKERGEPAAPHGAYVYFPGARRFHGRGNGRPAEEREERAFLFRGSASANGSVPGGRPARHHYFSFTASATRAVSSRYVASRFFAQLRTTASTSTGSFSKSITMLGCLAFLYP